MAESQAINSVGVRFRRWNPALAGSNKWEDMAEIKGIDGPTKSRDTIDTTTLSTTGGYKTFIASFRDGGNVSLKMNFTRDTYEIMNDDFESDVKKNYEIVIPDTENTTLEFEGLVTELPISIQVGDVITSDVTIKVNGKVYINSGASTGLTDH